MKHVELLVPVGNKEILEVAINNGADAVYLGGKKFGARAYASNFNDEEMVEAIRLCHLKHVKVYVTVNTMIYNDEILEVIDYLKFLYQHRVDAVIMQDMGLISLTRDILPDLEIHVSTQAHNHNNEQIKFYKDLGIKRLVLDRELSLEEIKGLDNDIEKEIFIYGALCVSYSGNCLFSALNGGRSANRGECTQCCRMPYKFFKNGHIEKDGYLLSMKDLNTLDHLEEILNSGVTSLKIEGRMKNKEYVACVTRIYRQLIDDFYQGKKLVVNKEMIDELMVSFNRGFTKGYLFKNNDLINDEAPNHQGIVVGKVIDVNKKMITISLSSSINQGDAIRLGNVTGMYLNTMYDKNEKLVNHIDKGVLKIRNKDGIKRELLEGKVVRKTFDVLLSKEINLVEEKKVGLQMVFIAQKNKEISLEVDDGVNKVKVFGVIPLEAIKRPIFKESVIKQLSKLGDTGYFVSSLRIDMDDDLFINIRDLNELRRVGITSLKEKVGELNEVPDREIKSSRLKEGDSFKYSVLVRTEEQLKVALNYKMDYIYVTDKSLYDKYKSFENVYRRLERVNDCEGEFDHERLLCTELGGLYKYSKNNIVRSDYPLNIANDYTMELFKRIGCTGNCLSVELDDVKKVIDKENAEIIVYGTIEVMTIRNNIFEIKDEDKCFLENKEGKRFKVVYDALTHIFNGTPIDRRKMIKDFKGIGVLRIDLLDEDRLTTEKILKSVKMI